MDGKNKSNFDQQCLKMMRKAFFRALVMFLLLLVAIALGWMLIDILTPIFVGLLLAIVFGPVLEWLKKHLKFPNWLSVTVLLLTLTIITVGLMVWLMPILTSQITGFIKNVPGYIEMIMTKITEEPYKLSSDFNQHFTTLSKKPETFLPFILKGSVKSLGLIANTLNILSYVSLYVLLLVVFFVAFCLYLPGIHDWIWQFLPASRKKQITKASEKIYAASIMFLRTRLIIAVIMAVIFSVGWAITGVPYWLLLGVLTGFLNIIPYASGFGWIIALLVNALETNSPDELIPALILPTIIFAGAQLLEGWVLTPVIQGEKLNVNPIVVLFAVLAGGVLFGILGMLLAIPLVAAIQIVFKDIIKPELLSWAKNN